MSGPERPGNPEGEASTVRILIEHFEGLVRGLGDGIFRDEMRDFRAEMSEFRGVVQAAIPNHEGRLSALERNRPGAGRER